MPGGLRMGRGLTGRPDWWWWWCVQGWRGGRGAAEQAAGDSQMGGASG